MLERIRSLCKAKRIMIKDLEQQAGLAYNTLNRWDIISPSVDKVAAVADVLCVSVDELIGRTPPRISKSERMILDLLDQLNEDGQTAALKQMQFLSLQPEYIKSDIPEEPEAIIDAEA